MVGGVGVLVGSTDRSSLPLSILATAVVAVAFQPVREQAQSLANRLVGGRRSHPNVVLSQLSALVAESSSIQPVLIRMLQLLVDVTGTPPALIHLSVGG